MLASTVVGVMLTLAQPLAEAQMTATSEATVQTCFNPGGKCSERIVDQIDKASSEIRLQAMLLSLKNIQKALSRAHDRGVNVQIILDKRQEERIADAPCAEAKKYPASLFASKGIPVYIDDELHTAHNKIMIIDRQTVVGGSFNYTYNADRRNGENVTFTKSRSVAAQYLTYWDARRAKSRPFATPERCKKG